MTKKRNCEYCERGFWTTNIKSHLKKCIYKTELDLPKRDVLKLIKEKGRGLKKFDQRAEVKLQQLVKFLQQTYFSSNRMFKTYSLDTKDPIEKINEMGIAQSTKENYLSVWKQYMTYIRINRFEICKETANSYLASLTNKETTIKQKARDLQYLFRSLIDPYIVINPYRKKVEVTPKYSLKDEELNKYLEEQKRIDKQDYLIQLMLAKYGLRINTAASLRLKHLTFLKKEDKIIMLPDIKSKRSRTEPIDEEMILLFKNLINENQIEDDNKYIFYTEDHYNNNNRKRSA